MNRRLRRRLTWFTSRKGSPHSEAVSASVRLPREASAENVHRSGKSIADSSLPVFPHHTGCRDFATTVFALLGAAGQVARSFAVIARTRRGNEDEQGSPTMWFPWNDFERRQHSWAPAQAPRRPLRALAHVSRPTNHGAFPKRLTVTSPAGQSTWGIP